MFTLPRANVTGEGCPGLQRGGNRGTPALPGGEHIWRRGIGGSSKLKWPPILTQRNVFPSEITHCHPVKKMSVCQALRVQPQTGQTRSRSHEAGVLVGEADRKETKKETRKRWAGLELCPRSLGLQPQTTGTIWCEMASAPSPGARNPGGQHWLLLEALRKMPLPLLASGGCHRPRCPWAAGALHPSLWSPVHISYVLRGPQ